MTLADDHEQAALHALSETSKTQQLLFSLLVCERMASGLTLFGQETGFDVTLYRNCLDACWTYAENGTPIADAEILAGCCFNQAPDTEDFSHPLVSAALDAAVSIGWLLNFVCDGSLAHVVEIVRSSIDTVFLYIQGAVLPPSGDNDLAVIFGHPLMQIELAGQIADIGYIVQANKVGRAALMSELRTLAQAEPRVVPFRS